MAVLKIFLIAFGFICFPSFAFADTHAAASCENQEGQLDVQTAINASDNGDTVTVPAGTCTWTTSPVLGGKQITLQGAGTASTVITGAINAASTSNFVITGFHFYSAGGEIVVCSGDGWRIHDNIFETTSTKGNGVFVRGVTGAYNPTGLIDNNTFIGMRVLIYGYVGNFADGQWSNATWYEAMTFGDADSVYVENNSFVVNLFGDIIEANDAGSVVARYNDISADNQGGSMLEMHSINTANNRGARKWELYRNKMTGDGKYTPFFIRSGTGFCFENDLDGTFDVTVLHVDNERTGTDAGGAAGLCDGDSTWDGNDDASGWPCRDQVGRGRDNPQWDNDPAGEYTQESRPAYFWYNQNPDTSNLPVSVINGSATDHIKANRDYYDYNASFDGTTGVGRGALASRPATCTAGVGYFATDTGTLGTFYKCTSTDTWESYYTPYTCPHPLAGAGTCSTTVAGTSGYTLGTPGGPSSITGGGSGSAVGGGSGTMSGN